MLINSIWTSHLACPVFHISQTDAQSGYRIMRCFGPNARSLSNSYNVEYPLNSGTKTYSMTNLYTGTENMSRTYAYGDLMGAIWSNLVYNCPYTTVVGCPGVYTKTFGATSGTTN